MRKCPLCITVNAWAFKSSVTVTCPSFLFYSSVSVLFPHADRTEKGMIKMKASDEVLYLLVMYSWCRLSLEGGRRKCEWERRDIEREMQGSAWHGSIYRLQKILVDLNAAQGGLQVCVCVCVCVCTSYMCILNKVGLENSQQYKKNKPKQILQNVTSNGVVTLSNSHTRVSFPSFELHEFPLRSYRLTT